VSAGEWGFFIGLTPGAILAIKNMVYFQKVINRAESIARASGQLLDFNLSSELKSDFLLRPSRLIKANDSPAIVEAKTCLLEARRGVLRRHALAFAYIAIGAFVGMVSAIALSEHL